MKQTRQEIMEEDFKTAYGIIHQYLVNIDIARKQGRPVDQHERGIMLLRAALLDYEEKIRDELGFEVEEDEEETSEP